WAGYLRHPGTGLYDAGARLYDPASGLFLEPDPVLPVPDAPETWSRYGYALGDPVGGWDPDGRLAFVPVLAYLAWTAINTAVDVAVEAALANLAGAEFDVLDSFAKNGAINLLTAGAGGKLKNAGRAGHFLAGVTIDATITTAADAVTASRDGREFDAFEAFATHFTSALAGHSLGNAAVAGLRRVGGSVGVRRLGEAWQLEFSALRQGRADFLAGGGKYLTGGLGPVGVPGANAVDDALTAAARVVGGRARSGPGSPSRALNRLDGSGSGGGTSSSREARYRDVIEAADTPLIIDARHPLLRSSPKHHIFPQANRKWFAERGVDIDRYTIKITEGDHSALHYGGGPGKGGGFWNDEIMRRLLKQEQRLGRQLTPREILRVGAMLRREAGLQHVKVEQY
ncbi:DUF2380 domain-containing protein, partial [Myxococcota bacterium]|nr:DUF2380 domain-containing protein [Myxococcota bacterium]